MLIIEEGITGINNKTQEVYVCSECGCPIGYRDVDDTTGEITNDDRKTAGQWWNYCMNCGSSLHVSEWHEEDIEDWNFN